LADRALADIDADNLQQRYKNEETHTLGQGSECGENHDQREPSAHDLRERANVQ
jgi:hypothetical protein